MSAKLTLACEVTNMAIMGETLKRLNIKNAKTKDGYSIERPYYNIDITDKQIICDSMHAHEVEKIKCEYQRDYQIHEKTLSGERFEITETNDEIVFLVQ